MYYTITYLEAVLNCIDNDDYDKRIIINSVVNILINTLRNIHQEHCNDRMIVDGLEAFRKEINHILQHCKASSLDNKRTLFPIPMIRILQKIHEAVPAASEAVENGVSNGKLFVRGSIEDLERFISFDPKLTDH